MIVVASKRESTKRGRPLSRFDPRPEDVPRSLRLVGAIVLGVGLHGVLLVHALDAPGDGWRWVFYCGYVIVFGTAAGIALRRDHRWRIEREQREQREQRERAAGRTDGVSP